MGESSGRLFLALSVTDVEAPLSALVKKLRINADREGFDFRWTPSELRHITVLFLGQIPSERKEDLMDRVREVAERSPPLKLKISGLGAFPDERSGRVLWAGVQNSKGFRALQDRLREGLEADFGPFGEISAPHLTLGRMKSPQSLRDLMSPFVRQKIGRMQADEVLLYESVRRPPFPVYLEVARFRLAGAPLSEDGLSEFDEGGGSQN